MTNIDALFTQERLETARSQDNSPIFTKTNKNLKKIFEENFYWQKNDE